MNESGRAYSFIISLISYGVVSGKGSAELADLITGWPDLCLVLALEGTVCRGRRPEVGETVRFLPEHCMMQKVHSGVVVHFEGMRGRIKGIDLKVC